MSKTKLTALCGALALVGAGLAHAGTLEDIAQKNRELQVLKVDVEIAKKKSELKLAIEGKAEGQVATAPANSGSMPGVVAKPAAGRVPDAVDADIAIKSISGDVSNPTVEFTVDGEDVASVTKGGSITRNWKLVSVDGRTVVIEQAAKKGRKGTTRTLYLTKGTTSAGVTRYDTATNGAPGTGVAMPAMPSMPNMPSMSMPPLPGGGMTNVLGGGIRR
jgi:hypothetical protein